MSKITEAIKRGRPKKDTVKSASIHTEEDMNKLFELCSLVDYISQSGSGSNLNDITLADLYSYFRNPYKNLKSLRKASEYLTLKHGIIKDVYLAFSRLPTLNYHIYWSSFDNPKQIKKYEKKIYDFLDEVNIKKATRNLLYETPKDGTVVTCLRNNKYIQFFELDNLRINKQLNGNWVVEYDLSTIKQPNMSTNDIQQVIESLPEEITIAKYNNYIKKGEDYRFVAINNCDVIQYDGLRNYPYGFPMAMGAWTSLIQKELINKVERSQADSLIKKVLILSAGYIGDDKSRKPVPRNVVEFYFSQVKNLLIKKDSTGFANSSDVSGTGVVYLPEYLKLQPLDVNITQFTKELYSKIEADILANLGVSSALIYGGGETTNYASADLNIKKITSYIFGIVEQFEYVLNKYISSLLPAGLECKIQFDRMTYITKSDHVGNCKELYMQTGLATPWIESVLGVPYHYALSMKKYEDVVLKLDELLNPPLNAYTSSPKDNNGRPVEENPSENTIKNKASSGGDNPAPSKK